MSVLTPAILGAAPAVLVSIIGMTADAPKEAHGSAMSLRIRAEVPPGIIVVVVTAIVVVVPAGVVVVVPVCIVVVPVGIVVVVLAGAQSYGFPGPWQVRQLEFGTVGSWKLTS